MLRLTLLAALAVVATTLPTSPAHAIPVTGPDGPKCGLVSVPAADGAQTGVLFAGPLVVTDPSTAGFASGTVTCIIRPWPGGMHYEDGQYAWRTATGTGVVQLATPVTYGRLSVSVCTQFTYSTGEQFYWDAWTEEWTTDSFSYCENAEAAGVILPDETVNGAVCPVAGSIPFFGTTVQNLVGCFAWPGDIANVGGNVVVPDL